MRDITTTLFGLFIAYLVPGVSGLYGLRYFSTAIQNLFDTFFSVKTNVGLFFWAIIVALIVGLIVNSLRLLIFEKWRCKSERLTEEDIAEIDKQETKLKAFQVVIDENFRYHQCYGNLFLTLPICIVGWTYTSVKSSWPPDGNLILKAVLLWLLILTIEIAIYRSAIEGYLRFVRRTKSIMGS